MSERDPNSARYTPPTYAGDVIQLLDELEIDRGRLPRNVARRAGDDDRRHGRSRSGSPACCSTTSGRSST